MRKTLKIIAHVVLFLVAFIVFYLGLGIGLTRDPNLGTAFWALAAAIALGNIFCIYKTRPQKQ
ncbi:MAG: hypothetical protein OXM03_03925 [Chloroflexota bacterium]|nr:hypothetical protein [Chloroflexota bacterium]